MNVDTARVARELRKRGDLEAYGAWVRGIEEAGAAGPARTTNCYVTQAEADAAEDCAEARFLADPSEETARALLRKRAADRQASLDHDRELAAAFGLTL